MFKALMILFAVFTVFDMLVTGIGLGVGCVELNTFVLSFGLGFWTLFRIVLLTYLLVVFFAGYRFFQSHFSRWLPLLRTGVVILDVYMGAIVFSGVLTILSRVLI
jgi:hypothetical protein